MNEDKIQGATLPNAGFIGLLPGVTYTNTHGTVARVRAFGGQISICGIDVGPAYGGEALARPGDTVLVTEKRVHAYSVFSASMDWPSERKALEAEAFKEIGKWTEITGDKPLSKPIDQAEALEQLFEANMELAKELTKNYGNLQGSGRKPKCLMLGCNIPDGISHTHPTYDPSMANLNESLHFVQGSYVIYT